MSEQYEHGGEDAQSRQEPKIGLADRNRSTVRRHKVRNDLYRIAAEFKARHPEATAAAAWAHFTMLAGISTTIIEHDPRRGLRYVPDADRLGERWISRAHFRRQWDRLGI
jgi:hypothetical protein